jgi:GNAT superfamily N-acetyltransferase
MVWRATGEEAKTTDRRARKAAMQDRIERGVPVGLLAYKEGEPVAWCSVAPRATHREPGGPDDFPGDDNAVWSLTCFNIARAHRGQGIANALLEAAIAHARRNGARVLEAYPVDPGSPSYTYMGLVPQFEKRRFSLVGHAGKRRHVYRLEL